MPLKNSFGKKPGLQNYRLGLKRQATREDTLVAQAAFERELRLWLKDRNLYIDGAVEFCKRGMPSNDGGGNVIIRCKPVLIGEILEKFGDSIDSVHTAQPSDILTYKGNQPRP